MLVLLWSCTKEPPPETFTTPLTTTTSTVTTTTTTTLTTTTTTTTSVTWECENLAQAPLSVRSLDGMAVNEDFAITEEGWLVAIDGANLVRHGYPPGAIDPFAPMPPDGGAPASLRVLPDGDFVYHDVNTSALYRVTPEGSVTPVFSGFGYAGGIEVHPSGAVYVVDLRGLHWFDPTFLEHELYFEVAAPWQSPNGITLSLAGDRVFVGARGTLWAVDVDASGRPVGEPVAWATVPGTSAETLGMGADACGNVYALSNGADNQLWRFPIDGSDPVLLLDAPNGAWMSNLQWGRGAGGFEATHVYVVDRGVPNTYYEVVLDVGEKPR